MDCIEAQELLSPFADGEVEAGSAKDLEDHLSKCPACSRQLESVRKLQKVADRLGGADPSGGVWTRIGATLASRPASARRIPYAACAAAVLLAASLAVYFAAAGPGRGDGKGAATDATPSEGIPESRPPASSAEKPAAVPKEKSPAPRQRILARIGSMTVERTEDGPHGDMPDPIEPSLEIAALVCEIAIVARTRTVDGVRCMEITQVLKGEWPDKDIAIAPVSYPRDYIPADADLSAYDLDKLLAEGKEYLVLLRRQTWRKEYTHEALLVEAGSIGLRKPGKHAIFPLDSEFGPGILKRVEEAVAAEKDARAVDPARFETTVRDGTPAQRLGAVRGLSRKFAEEEVRMIIPGLISLLGGEQFTANEAFHALRRLTGAMQHNWRRSVWDEWWKAIGNKSRPEWVADSIASLVGWRNNDTGLSETLSWAADAGIVPEPTNAGLLSDALMGDFDAWTLDWFKSTGVLQLRAVFIPAMKNLNAIVSYLIRVKAVQAEGLCLRMQSWAGDLLAAIEAGRIPPEDPMFNLKAMLQSVDGFAERSLKEIAAQGGKGR